jgi:hypothetical protein
VCCCRSRYGVSVGVGVDGSTERVRAPAGGVADVSPDQSKAEVLSSSMDNSSPESRRSATRGNRVDRQELGRLSDHYPTGIKVSVR